MLRSDLHSKQKLLEMKMRIFLKVRALRALLASAALAAFSGSALAADSEVKLTGAEETPPVTTLASGTETIRIGADKSVSGTVKTTGIDGTMAHIHVGAPGQSGPPIITLNKGAGGTWLVPEGSKLTDEQYASFKAGNLYVNVHSAEHKPGEIRAQLKP
jgi:CHRD domain